MTPQKKASKDAVQIELTENALKVLERRYLKKDHDRNVIETSEDLFKRISSNIAEAEIKFGGSKEVMSKWASDFYKLMASCKFMPNSPTLMNAGSDLQQLSACFVLPVNDSMEAIFEAIKHTALIHKSGGGTGFSFSKLRPRNDTVQSTKGVSSGPVSFMKVFNSATEAIKQGGTRRGANMGILRVDHPDIMEFIGCKEDLTELTNFNISVALTEEFMMQAEKGEDYSLKNPRTGEPMGTLNAGKVFATIVEKAWGTGEPGIIFIDRINRDNPTPSVGEIESTNPCGEQPLLPYESCNLGSLNLSRFIKKKGIGYEIDWDDLGNAIDTSIRFLDNVIEMNNYPLKEIGEMTRANRKVGLGVMGFADLLLQLNIPYNSDDGIELGEQIMAFLQQRSVEASRNLAKEREAFPNFEISTFKEKGDPPVRNATTTTIAPTGTISIIAGCSSGIEPIFALSYTRTVMDNDKLLEVNPIFEKVARERGFYSEELMLRIAQEGSIAHFEEIPQDIRDVFVTAHDISPEWHIKMQAAFQQHTDNAVSKTVNFPNSATQNDVGKVYWLAYRLGCKGVTIYRDGSRQMQVLTTGKSEKKPETAVATIEAPAKLEPRKRPDVVIGSTMKVATGCGNMYITVNEDEIGLYEVFSQLGKTGGCIASHAEAISRLISLSLKSGVDPEEIIDQLRGIRCPNAKWHKGKVILSCADAIGQVIDNYLKMREARKEREKGQMTLALDDMNRIANNNGSQEKSRGSNIADLGPECPDCGGMVEFSEGCVVCRLCGYSKC